MPASTKQVLEYLGQCQHHVELEHLAALCKERVKELLPQRFDRVFQIPVGRGPESISEASLRAIESKIRHEEALTKREKALVDACISFVCNHAPRIDERNRP